MSILEPNPYIPTLEQLLPVAVALLGTVALRGTVALPDPVSVFDTDSVETQPPFDPMDSFFTIDEGLVPIRAPHSSLSGTTSLDLSSLDDILKKISNDANTRPIKIYEDGGKIGCGGVLWISGKALALYLLQNWDKLMIDLKVNHGIENLNRIIELGAGTGITGIALGLFLESRISKGIDTNTSQDFKIDVTDIPNLVTIMNQNVELNQISTIVNARVLSWGEELPQDIQNTGVDLVLAADCVYHEVLFDILRKTLVDLCKVNKLKYPQGSKRETVILMASRKRRRADVRFFKKAKKCFNMVEIKDYKEYEEFRNQNIHILKMTLKDKFYDELMEIS
ncbi:unnamed protein product [[Candida] boidinii]|nr:unnamed protein product [[Candida] boidinii]